MSDELLCDACQRFLSGENPLLDQRNGHLIFSHHPTAESFQQALTLPCEICRRVRAGLCRTSGYPGSNGWFQEAPTTIHMALHEEGHDYVEEEMYPLFTCAELRIHLHLKPEKPTDPTSEATLRHPGVADADKSLTYDYTGSDACMEFALSQLKRCRDTHTKCQSMPSSRDHTIAFLPTRLLDVGRPGAINMTNQGIYKRPDNDDTNRPHTPEEHVSKFPAYAGYVNKPVADFEAFEIRPLPSTIHLSETNDCAQGTRYVALSHRWGSSQPLQLTRTTAARLRAGFPSTELPKTFQDAIHVAHKMQARYLWIDSLCIIQDDPQDWHREAARMQDVYSGAICCIAATAAKDSNGGLFFKRDPQDLLPVRVKTTSARIHGKKTDKPLLAYDIGHIFSIPSIAIDGAPLNRRAWVAQERYLSTGTIHFTQELVFWECYESVTSEQDPTGIFIQEWTEITGRSAIQILKSHICNYKSLQMVACSEPTNPESRKAFFSIYSYWYGFRANYSYCNLTKESDILVALNGVARQVAEATGDTLVAGLWQSRLIRDMCWRRHITVPADTPWRPSRWRAPTWSWASIKCTVVDNEMWWDDEMLSTITNMATIDDLSVDQEPSGELIDASMVLRCRPIPIYPPGPDSEMWMPHNITVFLDDCTSSYSRYEGRDLSLVILRHCEIGRVTGLQGILALPSHTKIGSYKRVGCFGISTDTVKDDDNFDEMRWRVQGLLDAHHDAEETTIKLV